MNDRSELAVIDEVAEPPLPQNKRFYPALDGLRACAVLMVFWQHYFLLLFPTQWQWGWAGVDIFFVLSGFLITGILFDTASASHRFRNFYVRRALRIFPLYYGVFLLVLLTTPLMHWQWNITWLWWQVYLGNFIRFVYSHWFVASGLSLEALHSPVVLLDHPVTLYLGHFWSLSVEEQFYFIWPLAVYSLRDRVKLRNICLFVVVAMPFVRWAISLIIPESLQRNLFFYMLTPFRIDALLIGGLLALLIRGPEERLLRRSVPALAVVCILALFAIATISPNAHAMHGASASWMVTIGFSTIDLLAACIIWSSLQPGTLCFQFLSLAPLRRLGLVSYGFYVFHDIPHVMYVSIGSWLFGRSVMGVVLAPILIAFVSTLAISVLSYRHFELPILRLKERFVTFPSEHCPGALVRGEW